MLEKIYILRQSYLDEIIKRAWNGNVKVITGLRRSGKSVLLFHLYKDYLIKNGVNLNNIIEFKLDKIDHYIYRNPLTLYSKVKELIKNSEKYYLFIDEIQMSVEVKDETTNLNISIYDLLNGLKDIPNLDVYVTGSNSKMLSKDILTEFRGRSSQIHVHPLSFKEYYDYYGGNEDILLKEYMITGGMPHIINETSIEDKMNYLKNLYNEIYIKDIIERNNVKRKDVLDDLLDYLASAISSLTNTNKITNTLNSVHKDKLSHELVSNYVDYILDSFLVSKARRYDVKGKTYFEFLNKFYYEDIGLRNARLNFRQLDSGHIMENILYNELIRRGYSVDVGAIKIRTSNSSDYVEVDFVVNYLDKKIYIQSAFQMDDDIKVKQELRPLTLTGDFFKKVVVRNDILMSHYDENGIYHCKLTDFLLGRVDLING